MRNVIVTGANGFLGGYLVEELLKYNYTVYALVRKDNRVCKSLCSDRVRIISCDMRDIKMLPKILPHEDFEAVYHLAWSGSTGKARGDYKSQMENVLWTSDLIEAMNEIGISRLVVSGSVTQIMYRDYLYEDCCHPDMVTIYPIAKTCAESISKCLCAKYNINLCWTYIANFYGEGDTTQNFINYLIDNYSQGIVPELTNATQLADFSHVSDIARGLIAAGVNGKENTSYYLGCGKPRELRDFITSVRDIVNPLIESGIGKKEFNGRSIDYAKIDYQKLKRDTGFTSQITFEEGILRTIKGRMTL